MQKLRLLALVIFCSGGMCVAQSLDSLSQSEASQSTGADCSDPTQAGSAACAASQGQRSGGGQGNAAPPSVLPPVLRAAPNADQLTPSTPPTNPSQMPHEKGAIRPETEFEQMVADSVGRPLPLFGQSLFVQPPSTFSPIDWMLVP